MAYAPPTELHPIGVKAIALYEAGGRALSSADCAALKADLEALYGDFTALYDAVHSLGALMLYAEQQGRADAAREVTQIIKHTKPWFQAWNQRVKEDIGDEALAATRRMTRLLGDGVPRSAPVVGARRPAGTVSLASLRPPAGPMVR